MTFRLYGPGDATCRTTPVFESTVAVKPDGNANSASFEPTVDGTYRWVSSYSGDANNGPARGACNDPGQSVKVSVTVSPFLCGGTKIALIDVFPEGPRMIISGVAQPSLVGKRAKIVLESTGKTATTVTIGERGAFATSAKLPSKKLRPLARYKAVVDRSRSAALKLQRRSYMTRAAVRGQDASFAGRVTGDFKVGAEVSLQVITLCTKVNKPLATTKLRRDGTWQLRVPLPADSQNLLYRARTTVLKNRVKQRTFTLPRPLSLSGAPT